MARYGIPELEQRPRPELQGGAYRSTGSRNLSDLWAAIRAEEAQGHDSAARAQMAQQRQAAMMSSLMRRGVGQQGMQQAAQSGARVAPANLRQNPLLEAMATQVLQGSITESTLQTMRDILAAQKPSGLQQAIGLGLPLAGMMAGGILGAPSDAYFGLSGAAAGMGFGSGLSGLLTAY